ncbi:MAG: hypothetical protein ACREU9_11590, partial [Gammaproteobacteria bacterium]
MFSVEDFNALMKAGEVRLVYSFCPDPNGGVTNLGEQQVDPNQPELPSTSLFYKNYFGDRLKLTLGPIVKSHLDGPVVGRVAFGNFAGCVDLRASGNCIELAPHEVISVATNERITLRGNVAAYILPRLTNADAGLLYVPSYID